MTDDHATGDDDDPGTRGDSSPIGMDEVGSESEDDTHRNILSDDEASPFDALGEVSTDEDVDQLFENAFTAESTEDTDGESVWEELASSTARWTGSGGAADIDVVPKRNFCERCTHLSDPPEFRCTHDGTEIIELIDSDHVRVKECPIVKQRRGLETE